MTEDYFSDLFLKRKSEIQQQKIGVIQNRQREHILSLVDKYIEDTPKDALETKLSDK